MKVYELTYIISPEISLEEAESKAKEIESAIQSKDGIILHQANPAAKTLAYPVAKRASGFLGVLEFQAEPERLIELKETTLKDAKIVRHIITIKEPVKIRKERRSKMKEVSLPGAEITPEIAAEKAPAESKEKDKDKVDLKDIEQKLDEILGE